MLNPFQQRSGTALAATVSLVATAVSPFFAAPSLAQAGLSDIQGNWAQTCITQLTQQGVISGYPDGTFRPGAPVSRAEFAAMVGKAFPNAAKTRSSIRFGDVPANYWAYNAINTATQTGFLSGYPGNVFNPNQSIPRAQVLVSLSNGLNYSAAQPANTVLNANYVDASTVPAYAQPAIAAATERRLVVNYPNVQYLNPNQLATRADVSAFLCQALAGQGQFAAAVPAQYVAGGAGNTPAPVAQVSPLPAGTRIPVAYTAAERVIVAPGETAPLTLTVAQDIRNSQGTVFIPSGSQIIGQLQPGQGGSQFVASALVVNGHQVPIQATSNVVTTTRNVRDPNFGSLLGGAALGSAAAAGISGVTGDRNITSGKVLLGTAIGAAAGANQNRNLGLTIRDAAIGAALGVGVSGVTGDRTITAEEVLTGAATGAAIGGTLDRGVVNEVVVIDPETDLTLTLNSPINAGNR